MNTIKKIISEEFIAGNLYGYHCTPCKNLESIEKSGFIIGPRQMQGSGVYGFYNLTDNSSGNAAVGYGSRHLGDEFCIVKFTIEHPNWLVILNKKIAEDVLGNNSDIIKQISNQYYDWDEFINKYLFPLLRPEFKTPEYVEKYKNYLRQEFLKGETGQKNILFGDGQMETLAKFGIIYDGEYGIQFLIKRPNIMHPIGYYNVKYNNGRMNISNYFPFTGKINAITNAINTNEKYSPLREYLPQIDNMDSLQKLKSKFNNILYNVRNNREYDNISNLINLIDELSNNNLNETMKTKNLNDIIKEEIINLHNEGVADKYAEKEFNIPDPNKEKEIKAISNIKPEDNNAQLGTLVGTIIENDLKINVYLNPKNLNDFDKNVRAITVGDSGDLFVTQLDGNFSHDNIVEAVNNGGVYSKGLYDAYDEEHNITWHRASNSASNTNNFGLSGSYMNFASYPKNKPIIEQMITKAKQKNPNYNFIPEYWLNLRYKTNNPTLPDTSETNLHESIITELENLIDNNDANLINSNSPNHNSPNLNENIMNENIGVWHGSTEKFNNFDLEKIGSGDGKSLGGWGIYFSDSPEVSQRYYLPKGQLKQHEIRKGKYFDFDEPLENGQNILNGLNNLGISDNDLEEFQETYIDNYDTNGKQAYDWLTYVLGGEKEASMFLESLGYIGNTMMDRWETGARNYVIFNTKSIIQ